MFRLIYRLLSGEQSALIIFAKNKKEALTDGMTMIETQHCERDITVESCDRIWF